MIFQFAFKYHPFFIWQQPGGDLNSCVVFPFTKPLYSFCSMTNSSSEWIFIVSWVWTRPTKIKFFYLWWKKHFRISRGPARSCVMIRVGLVFDHHLSVCKSTWVLSEGAASRSDVTRWSKIGALKYQIDLHSGKQSQKLNHLLSSPSQVQLHSLTPKTPPSPRWLREDGKWQFPKYSLAGQVFFPFLHTLSLQHHCPDCWPELCPAVIPLELSVSGMGQLQPLLTETTSAAPAPAPWHLNSYTPSCYWIAFIACVAAKCTIYTRRKCNCLHRHKMFCRLPFTEMHSRFKCLDQKTQSQNPKPLSVALTAHSLFCTMFTSAISY